MNITTQLRRSIAQDVLWSINNFTDVFDEIERQKFHTQYWKDEENWAIIVNEKEPVAFLWKKYPLIFVSTEFFVEMNFLDKFEYLEIICVDSFIVPNLKVDDSSLSYLFDGGIDLNGFSVDELWFRTNSL